MTRSLAHVSVRPWSELTKADYTPEQWHAACLIHQHQGAPTSKDQCKLPVRTPNGAVNRNGVHAAAAALAGARGGVNASPAEKSSAAKALLRLYAELGEDPPESLKHSSISHYGIRGMKWGVVRSRKQIDDDSEDVVRVKGAKEKIKANRTTNVLSNKELQDVVTRMNLEQQYSRLISEGNKNKSVQQQMLETGRKMATDFVIEKGKDRVADMVAAKNPIAGAIIKEAFEAQREAAQQGKKKKK